MENNNVTWSSNNATLPVGFLFKPTDYELLVNYLFNKVHGNPLPSPTFIIDCDVYGEGGAWKRLFVESEEDTLHFFTRLKKKHENGKRVDRVTEWGTWKGQGDKEIYGYNGDQKVKIGSKRSFSFMPKKGVQEMRGKWVMHEYRLDGCLLDDQNNNSWWYVVCRIINKKSKRTRNARDNDDDRDDSRALVLNGPSDHVQEHYNSDRIDVVTMRDNDDHGHEENEAATLSDPTNDVEAEMYDGTFSLDVDYRHVEGHNYWSNLEAVTTRERDFQNHEYADSLD